jgi:hypothetical protein
LQFSALHQALLVATFAALLRLLLLSALSALLPVLLPGRCVLKLWPRALLLHLSVVLRAAHCGAHALGALLLLLLHTCTTRLYTRFGKLAALVISLRNKHNVSSITMQLQVLETLR